MTEELLTAEVRIRLTPTEKQQLKSLANANELPLTTTEIVSTPSNDSTIQILSSINRQQYRYKN